MKEYVSHYACAFSLNQPRISPLPLKWFSGVKGLWNTLFRRKKITESTEPGERHRLPISAWVILGGEGRRRSAGQDASQLLQHLLPGVRMSSHRTGSSETGSQCLQTWSLQSLLLFLQFLHRPDPLWNSPEHTPLVPTLRQEPRNFLCLWNFMFWNFRKGFFFNYVYIFLKLILKKA